MQNDWVCQRKLLISQKVGESEVHVDFEAYAETLCNKRDLLRSGVLRIGCERKGDGCGCPLIGNRNQESLY